MISPEALAYATTRVGDFANVNRPLDHPDRMGSVDIWLTGLGLDDEMRASFGDWCDDLFGPGWEGPVTVGLAVGLFVLQYYEENHEV